jgi:hypothetical protein
MLVALTTEGASSVCLLAGRADRSLGIERRLDTIRLPLNHPDRQWLVDELPICIGTIVVQRKAHVRCRPRLSGVRVSNATHVPCFVVPFAFLANC